MSEGIVFKKSTGTYYVNVQGEVVVCSISNSLRKELIYPFFRESKTVKRVQKVKEIPLVDPVAVGDVVSFVPAGHDGNSQVGVIHEVLPRKSKLTRRATGSKPLEQVVVANVDQIVVVSACAQPQPKWGMLDRYLVSAESCEIPAVICMNKVDLLRGSAAEAEVMAEIETYQRAGYTVLVTSAQDEEGLEAFKGALRGRVSAFVGMSGVGKTSLLNRVQPGLGLRVSQINTNIDKGRHTTTHLEMFSLDFGGAIVDTPGMKTFGLWDTGSEEIILLFREMAPYAGRCRFGLRCTHQHEPGCALLLAVEAGKVSARRYASYLYIRDHLDAGDK